MALVSAVPSGRGNRNVGETAREGGQRTKPSISKYFASFGTQVFKSVAPSRLSASSQLTASMRLLASATHGWLP